MKKQGKIIGAGVLTAIASSLCCITPVLALISGTSGAASSFSWMEPFRPYLIGFTVLVLGFAWYQKLKTKKEMNCDCETDEKPSFLQSKLFLGIVTVFAIVMTLFPYYSSVFYPENKKIIIVDSSSFKTESFKIEGMTCQACENHIDYSVQQLEGITETTTSYDKGISEVKYDKTKTTIAEITKAINATGYTVQNSQTK